MIYLDNSSTTKPCKEAVEAMVSALSEDFGNPSSLHRLGITSESIITSARKSVASALGCDVSSVYFTSGATESNNTVVFGAAEGLGKRKKRIVTTSVEHPSVAEPISKLEKAGFEVIRVAPDENGEITAESIASAVDENTCLVSCMYVNNETGYILPIAEAFAKIKRLYPETVTHCDCVQAFMKIPVNPKSLHADAVSLSAHKIHGPKGIGALYVAKGTKIKPFIVGGGQEKGFRSGTESVPLIAGFGAAVEKLLPTVSGRLETVSGLKAHLVSAVRQLEGVTVNSSDKCLPYVVSISVPNIKSETALHFLEQYEIYVSSGSACSRGKKSSVLKEFKIPDKLIDSTIRISMCAENTPQELDELVSRLALAQEKLVKIR